jgi:Arc/MetJ family transcription regulator
MRMHQMQYHQFRHRSLMMRTTLDIDDDVLDAAKAIGRQTHRTAGAVLSELARRALTTSPSENSGNGKRARGVGGFVPFESRGGIVTNELIDRLREGDAY